MMNGSVHMVVLGGGPGAEREVSLASAESVVEAMRGRWAVDLVCLDQAVLPESLDARRDVVFPLVHGTYGEDGSMQSDLEAAGIAYAGCDAAASRLCINKRRAKEVARREGLRVSPQMFVEGGNRADAAAILEAMGESLVIKPVAEGSSVGLHVVTGEKELSDTLGELAAGDWMIEARVPGHDITVGVIEGEPLGIVEIIPSGGTYDYHHKYTPGRTTYRCPAEIPASIAETIRRDAARVFAACGCRDFARVDFILQPDGAHTFLEINTIPGMTATSLLPKSAACHGLDFGALVERMRAGALSRFQTIQTFHAAKP